MARENLGLLDTPPNRQEISLGLGAVGLQFLVILALSPWLDIRLREIGSFIPMADATMCVGELIIATKLYAQAAIFQSRALTVLASGYVFGALLLIPHALTFPGAFAVNGLLGAGVNTTSWLAAMIKFALPISVILYVTVKSRKTAEEPERRAPRVFEGLAASIALAAVATIWTTLGRDWLPPLFLNYSDGIFLNLLIACAVLIVLTIAAMVLLFRRLRSVLDMWLLVALSGWLFQAMLTPLVAGRFTVGWYAAIGQQVASSFIVMVAMIAETNRLYAQLAVWAVARTRERENRMMSMDALAAAFSHEIGQPLTAVTLSASAGLKYLTREKPDADRAIQSLRDNLDAAHRTFAVLKSIRTAYAKGSGSMSEFDLNDLVRETTSLMAGELAAQKVSLQLKLDQALPPIFADRVQIQRVLVNLLSNAIEALGSVGRRGRRIAIRSGVPHRETLLLEITDNGAGIALEKMAEIFDPFFTTKSTGTGLGLSLSKTIAEEHGGRLWCSQAEGGGATFHLQLRRNSVLQE